MVCPCMQTVHDYQHVGVTNDYLVSTSDALALRYNDRWVTLTVQLVHDANDASIRRNGCLGSRHAICTSLL